MAIYSSPVPPASVPAPAYVSTFWTWVALLFALIAAAGTLWMSLGHQTIFGMELIPCPLCLYQRALILALAAVLLLGLLAGPRRSGYLSLITLPVTVAGLGIAGYQAYLEYDGQLKCPDGVLINLYEDFAEPNDFSKQIRDQKLGTVPKEGLAVFTLIFLVQLIDLLRSNSRGGFGLGPAFIGIILGGLMAWGMIVTIGPSEIEPRLAPLKCQAIEAKK